MVKPFCIHGILSNSSLGCYTRWPEASTTHTRTDTLADGRTLSGHCSPTFGGAGPAGCPFQLMNGKDFVFRSGGSAYGANFYVLNGSPMAKPEYRPLLSVGGDRYGGAQYIQFIQAYWTMLGEINATDRIDVNTPALPTNKLLSLWWFRKHGYDVLPYSLV